VYKQQGTAQEEAHIQEWHLTWVLKDGLKVIEIVDSMRRHEPRAIAHVGQMEAICAGTTSHML
jgi:hypothetical protein